MKPTILYVDDEFINLEFFRVTFIDLFEVLIAESGEEGLEALQDHPEISAVISDIRMPEMDGIEFIRRARELNDQIPYYIITGYSLNSEMDELLKQHIIKGFYQKPYSTELIAKELLQVLKKQ
ncbi:MAG: response regulator [Cyclobacteriaceae bacterium]